MKGKGLKPSERQKVNEANKRVDKMSKENLMKDKSSTPTHDAIIEKGIKDPNVDQKTTEYLKKMKALKQKMQDKGELSHKEVREAAKKEREANYDKVFKDMEDKGEIASLKDRKMKAKRDGA